MPTRPRAPLGALDSGARCKGRVARCPAQGDCERGYHPCFVRVPKLELPDADALPLWPPLLATRGDGGASEGHAHHGMHLVLALTGSLRVSHSGGDDEACAGLLTAPDVKHALDARGAEILLVFLDPESALGRALCPPPERPVRLLSPPERDAIVASGSDPRALMGPAGVAWSAGVLAALGAGDAPPRAVHPRVKKALALVRAADPQADLSLETLASHVGLSAGRFMHAFTESIGIPLRPYLAWLRLQRAAAALASGRTAVDAAHAAGYADAAHMSRSFRRAFGMSPSAIQRAVVAGSQSVQARPRGRA